LILSLNTTPERRLFGFLSTRVWPLFSDNFTKSRELHGSDMQVKCSPDATLTHRVDNRYQGNRGALPGLLSRAKPMYLFAPHITQNPWKTRLMPRDEYNAGASTSSAMTHTPAYEVRDRSNSQCIVCYPGLCVPCTLLDGGNCKRIMYNVLLNKAAAQISLLLRAMNIMMTCFSRRITAG
jgi:hypothetical protein